MQKKISKKGKVGATLPPPPKLEGFDFSLKKFWSKNDLVQKNFGEGSKNCLDRIKLRGSEVSAPPRKTVGLKLFLIFVASSQLPNLGPPEPPFSLFVWVRLTNGG